MQPAEISYYTKTQVDRLEMNDVLDLKKVLYDYLAKNNKSENKQRLKYLKLEEEKAQ